ncbi:MAG TPA: SEC-C metal-binding domain-containing protein [Terriglobales bacterium]|jgi:hypothetical protein|nr:SEC-C metal-binding domain-containing protein [Terriglobales bacterium]
MNLSHRDKEFIAQFTSHIITEKQLTAGNVQDFRCVLFNPSNSTLITTDADPAYVEEHKRLGFYLIGGFVLYQLGGLQRIAPIHAAGPTTSATKIQLIGYLIATAATAYLSGSTTVPTSSEEVGKFDPSAPHVIARQEYRTAARKLGHVGRNDACACGSGRKYKKCCLN